MSRRSRSRPAKSGRRGAGQEKSHGGSAKRSARIVYGAGPITELIGKRASSIERLLVRSSPRGRVAEIGQLAVSAGVEVVEAELSELDSAAGAGANHQGVVAFTGAYEYAELEDVIDACLSSSASESSRPSARPIVVLDGVTDPYNLGAICRSAYLLGAAGLVIGRDRAAPVNSVATKASAGATEYLAIAQVTNLSRALQEMREAGIWRAQIAATKDSKPITEIDQTLPMAIVMGSEGRGLRALVARETDFAYSIPMTGSGVGSFNVSVAAALALYELSRG